MIRDLLNHPLLRFVPLVSILVVGAALSAASWVWMRQLEQRRVQMEFDSRAGEIEAVVSRRVGANLEVLNSIERLFAASQSVDAEEFEQFTRHALRAYPGIRLLAWAPRRADAAEERFPLEFAAPEAVGGSLRGIDIATLTPCATAMNAARDQAAMSATDPIDLAPVTQPALPGARFDALVFLPLYRKDDVDPANRPLEQRRADLLGFAVAAMQLDRLLDSALARMDLHGQRIQLVPASAGERAMPHDGVRAGPRGARTDLQPWRREILLAGRAWWLIGVPTDAYRASRGPVPVWAVPVVGMVFALLLGAYLHTLASRTARVQALVTRRTNELENANRTLAQEIDERRRTEKALSESEERHRAVVQHAADGITLVDADSLRIIEVNEAFARLLGYERGDLIGRHISELIVGATPQNVAARAAQTLDTAAPVVTHRQYRRRDGSTVDTEKSATVLELGGRRVLCTVVHDITERKKADEAIRASEERTRQIVETALDAFVAMDDTGRICGWNAQAEKTFGWSRAQAMGRILADTIVPTQYRQAHMDGIERFLRSGEGPVLNRRIEISALRRDGHEFPVELTISPLRVGETYLFNAFIHDITERKRAENELHEKHRQLEEAMEKLKQTQGALVQSEKLAGLGQMVAGVAHEINNPLAFVSNNVAVLQRDVRSLCEILRLYEQADELLAQHRAELMSQIKSLAERIDLAYTLENLNEMMTRSREGLGRIQQIVKDLREFARLDKGDLQEVSLIAGIESTINIVRGLAKKKQVTLDVQLGELPPIACYPAKINQVVMNLITNAIDASDPGKTVTVRAEADPSGDGVRIEVIDQGQGIDPAIRQRIFDPFFTTKPIGKGTGLGLSISYGIVQEHGGTIAVESEMGKGTRFIVTLPSRQPVTMPAPAPLSAASGADER